MASAAVAAGAREVPAARSVPIAKQLRGFEIPGQLGGHRLQGWLDIRQRRDRNIGELIIVGKRRRQEIGLDDLAASPVIRLWCAYGNEAEGRGGDDREQDLE